MKQRVEDLVKADLQSIKWLVKRGKIYEGVRISEEKVWVGLKEDCIQKKVKNNTIKFVPFRWTGGDLGRGDLAKSESLLLKNEINIFLGEYANMVLEKGSDKVWSRKVGFEWRKKRTPYYSIGSLKKKKYNLFITLPMMRGFMPSSQRLKVFVPGFDGKKKYGPKNTALGEIMLGVSKGLGGILFNIERGSGYNFMKGDLLEKTTYQMLFCGEVYKLLCQKFIIIGKLYLGYEAHIALKNFTALVICSYIYFKDHLEKKVIGMYSLARIEERKRIQRELFPLEEVLAKDVLSYKIILSSFYVKKYNKKLARRKKYLTGLYLLTKLVRVSIKRVNIEEHAPKFNKDRSLEVSMEAIPKEKRKSVVVSRRVLGYASTRIVKWGKVNWWHKMYRLKYQKIKINRNKKQEKKEEIKRLFGVNKGEKYLGININIDEITGYKYPKEKGIKKEGKLGRLVEKVEKEKTIEKGLSKVDEGLQNKINKELKSIAATKQKNSYTGGAWGLSGLELTTKFMAYRRSKKRTIMFRNRLIEEIVKIDRRKKQEKKDDMRRLCIYILNKKEKVLVKKIEGVKVVEELIKYTEKKPEFKKKLLLEGVLRVAKKKEKEHNLKRRYKRIKFKTYAGKKKELYMVFNELGKFTKFRVVTERIKKLKKNKSYFGKRNLKKRYFKGKEVRFGKNKQKRVDQIQKQGVNKKKTLSKKKRTLSKKIAVNKKKIVVSKKKREEIIKKQAMYKKKKR